MMKASIKPRETYFDGKLAYALDETEDPDYKPVLILGPGNIQRSKEKNHEKWARVFNSWRLPFLIVYWYSDQKVTVINLPQLILHHSGLETKYANLPLTTQLKKDGECTETEEKTKEGYREFMKDIKKDEKYRKKKVDYALEHFNYLF